MTQLVDTTLTVNSFRCRCKILPTMARLRTLPFSPAARYLLPGLCVLVALAQLSSLPLVCDGFVVAPLRQQPTTRCPTFQRHLSKETRLAVQSDNEGTDVEIASDLTRSTAWFLGVGGTIASLVTFYSEFTLKTTGCGIPAGPFGLFGLIEGLSYLGVTGVAAYSLVTKVKTGKGLPAGTAGLVGAAEGLSFLAIAAGLVVLALQVTDYGYIPNAVPMEGGMCS